MRLRVVIPTLALTAILFVFPYTALAQTIPFFGPIVPDAINRCPASFALFMDVVNRIILFSITIGIVFVAPCMIAYAGFLMVVNPFNSGGIQKAKDIMLHTVVGIVIALAGWLIVAALMAVLYSPTNGLKAWNTIISSGGLDACLKQEGALQTLNQAGNPSITGTTATGANTLSFGSGACDSSTVQQGAATGGYTLTTAQANTLACLAKPESTCGTKNQNYAWNTGTPGKPGSTAAGAFQVLLSTHSNCYENKACYQAAGVPRNLNCAAGFSNGNPKTDAASQALVQKCLQAAANTSCSASAAACVLQKQGFSAWTKDKSSSIQNQCIATYNI